MAMAVKAQKSANSPFKAQTKFRTRFDNPEISWSWVTVFDIAEIQIPKVRNPSHALLIDNKV